MSSPPEDMRTDSIYYTHAPAISTYQLYHKKIPFSITTSILYINDNYYRLQRSCEGYFFTPVCLSTGGSASVHDGIPPPPSQSRQPPPPWSRHTTSGVDTPSPGADTPLGTDLPGAVLLGADTPLGADTLQEQTPPGADNSLRIPPQQTPTAADGMHPIGMHSCFKQFNH